MKRIKQWLAARRLAVTMRPEAMAFPSKSHKLAWEKRRHNERRRRSEKFARDPIIAEVLKASKRKNNWEERQVVRSAIWLRDGPKCHYCAKRLQIDNPHAPHFATIEHIIPLFVGGPDTLENCVIACEPCNSSRGGRVSHLAKTIRHMVAEAQA